MKKLLILMMCMLLLVAPMVSAFDFDNVGYYDKESKTMKIKDCSLWLLTCFIDGENIVDTTLNSKQHEVITWLGYVKVGEFEINGKSNYEDLLKGIKKYNVNDGMKEIDVDFDLKIVGNESYIYTTIDGRKITNYRKTLIDIDDSKPINILKDEKIIIEIWTTVKDGDYVEWIPNIVGVRINEWASYSATGGTITTDGDYSVHTFTSSGWFNVTGTMTGAELLIVAGGGGTSANGGGGAGGYVANASVSIAEGNYSVTVGAGGSGTAGGNSQFDTTIAYGGGLGTGSDNNGGNGGSGAGGGLSGAAQTYGGTFIANQGKDGGGNGAVYAPYYPAGGGGGCGASGGNASGTVTGYGGNGCQNDIYNGTNLWYAGGGSGGTDGDASSGVAGQGGGGFNGSSGVANTGGGGAGKWKGTGTALGGSGIVIIRYLEVSKPKVTLNSPTNNTNSTTNLITFNCTASDDINLVNVSLILDGVVNETNSTDVVNGSFFYFTKNLADGDAYWSCRGADNESQFTTAGERLITIGDYFERSYTFNSTSYETKSEIFYVNITTNGTAPTSGKLIYNGTTYTATITNTVGNDYNISKTIDIPLVNESKPFYFNFTYLGIERSTTTQNQTINETVWTLCNATYTDNYLNISFKDEADNSVINASIPTSTFVYYFGSGLVNKTYTYINTSNNYNYTFCATPNLTLKIDPYIQYKQGTAYPQRVYDANVTSYTSTLTDKILYLLGVSDGIYVTFQVINTADQVQSGVEITATREISGVDTTVGQGTTGADGSVTLWLNPDFIHDFTFVKTGFTTYTTSFAPTQTAYTITLSGGVTVTSSYFKGIDFSILPINSSLINDTIYTFGFNLTSSFWDLTSYGFNLRLTNGTIITGDSTTTSGTPLTLNYNTTNQTKVYLDYYWIINSTTTSGIRVWVVYNIEYTQWSIATFFTDLTLYLDSGFFGIDDFGRSFLIFILIFFTAGIVSYKFGFTSPVAVSTTIFLTVFFLETVLGLIPPYVLASGYEIPSILSFITGLILIMVIFNEVKR